MNPILNEADPWLNYDWAQCDFGGGLLQLRNANGDPNVLGKHSRAENEDMRKGGKHIPARPSQRKYPAADVYARSDWGLMANGLSIASQMPFRGEFSGYSEWWEESKRWEKSDITQHCKFSNRLLCHK